MDGRIAFTVYGEAKPAGSKRAFTHPHTGRPILTDDSGKAGKDWRRAVADAALVDRELGEIGVAALMLAAAYDSRVEMVGAFIVRGEGS